MGEDGAAIEVGETVYQFEPGADVFLDVGGAHLWGDPTFNPGRFLVDGADGLRAVAPSRDLERPYFPFGVGYNYCPGSGLAAMTLRMVIAHICYHYNPQLISPGMAVESGGVRTREGLEVML